MSVAIFWDYENCSPPCNTPGFLIANNIRAIAHEYGSVKLFKAYLDLSEQSSSKTLSLRSELQQCGVSLTDSPHNGRKDVADKMIIVDMLSYAIDTPAPATIVLISGDRDFVYAVSVLRLRRYRIVLIAPNATHASLKAQASVVHDWPRDVLPSPTKTPAVPAPGQAPLTPSPTKEVDINREIRPARAASPLLDWASPASSSTLFSPSPPAPSYSQPATGRSTPNSTYLTLLQSETSYQTPKRYSWSENLRKSGTPAPYTLPKPRTTPPLSPGYFDHSGASPEPVLSPLISERSYYSPRSMSPSLQACKPHVPRYFEALVRVLQEERAEGVRRVPSSKLGSMLSSLVYEQAGVTRLKDYSLLAEEYGIVKVGKEDMDRGNYWLSLKSAYRV